MFIRSSGRITEASQPQLPRSGPSGQPIESSLLARPNHSHLRAHLHRYGVVLEDLLRPAKAAAFPLHDKIPKGVHSSIDETHSLRVAAIGCRLAATRSPVKGVQRIEGIPQFPGKAADCRRLLLTDLVFKDV